MRATLLGGAAALAFFGASTPVSADLLQVSYTGTASGFGFLVVPSLGLLSYSFNGDPFSATVLVDTSLGTLTQTAPGQFMAT
jgi:hypothetical protein